MWLMSPSVVSNGTRSKAASLSQVLVVVVGFLEDPKAWILMLEK
jgi:hypothetical protein